MNRCNAHTETGQVVRCQNMKTFIRQQAQLVGDPLWKVEPVQRANAVIRSQILVMVNNTKYEVSILSRSMDIEVSQNIHIID